MFESSFCIVTRTLVPGFKSARFTIFAITGDRGTRGQNVVEHFAVGTLRSELVSVYAHDIAFVRFCFRVFHSELNVW